VKRSGRPYIIICSFSLIIFFSVPETLVSQDAVNSLDRVYGLDQTLCNGKKYGYSPPPGARGNQYFRSGAYTEGSVTIRGKSYQGLKLNYDIFNQQLLLLYDDETGSMNIIEVSKAWLKNFSLGNLNFEFLDLEQKPRFFQSLGEGPFRIFYYWSKNVEAEGSIGSYYLTFTRAERDSYLFMNGQLKPFSTNRGLIDLFDPQLQPEIKSYLRKHKVNVRKATDQVMEDMITFIGNIK